MNLLHDGLLNNSFEYTIPLHLTQEWIVVQVMMGNSKEWIRFGRVAPLYDIFNIGETEGRSYPIKLNTPQLLQIPTLYSYQIKLIPVYWITSYRVRLWA